jgi:hypothetical protein
MVPGMRADGQRWPSARRVRARTLPGPGTSFFIVASDTEAHAHQGCTTRHTVWRISMPHGSYVTHTGLKSPRDIVWHKDRMAFDATLQRTQRHCCLPREFGVWHHLPHALRRGVAWLADRGAKGRHDRPCCSACDAALVVMPGRCWRREGERTVLEKTLRRGKPTVATRWFGGHGCG